MGRIKYLVRLDDACPTMNKDKWNKIESILDKYAIRPMVGVIPLNEDPELECNDADENFWNNVLHWEEKGWAIALHGCNHVYTSSSGGINPVHKRSEFAGESLTVQKKKIKTAVEFLKKKNIDPKFFFAPSHTFDLNTLIALKEESDIRFISDTISFYPYKFNDFCFIPQQFGRFKNIKIPGCWTFCFHPNTMTDSSVLLFEHFIENNQTKFISFHSKEIKFKEKISSVDKLYRFAYFYYRRFRNSYR
jgi:predicted deacetylase